MSQKLRQRIRIAFGESTSFDSEKDKRTSNLPKSWRGADVQVEAAIFDGSTFIDDISNIDTLILTVSAGAAGLSSAPLLQIEVDSAELNTTLAKNDWEGGDEDDCHYKFEITKDQMQFDFTGATNNQRELRMTLHGVTNDTTPRYITFGFASWVIVEDGVQNDLDVVGVSDRTVRVSSAGSLQIKHPTTGNWHDVNPLVIDNYLQLLPDQDESATQ